MSVKLQPAESAKHFQAVAELHSQGITEGFLSTLGNPFLRTLYKGIAQAEDSGVIIAKNDGKTLGFISYARDVKTCYRQVIIRNWPSLVLTMMPNIIKPNIFKKVFETLSYPSQHNKAEKEIFDNRVEESRPELLAMAVSQEARGMGVGKLLVNAVDEKMSHMGQSGYYVVTHGMDERANGFYQGRGFNKVREYTNHGKPMNEYYKKLSNLNPNSK